LLVDGEVHIGKDNNLVVSKKRKELEVFSFILIPRSFDWSAAFHLVLLQAVLFTAV